MARLLAPMNVSAQVRNFLFIVIDHRRVHELKSIIEAFENLADKRLGFVRADVASATEMPEAQRKVLEAQLSRLAGKKKGAGEVGGLTVLLTTHYLEEADRLASRLAIVDRGRVVTSGTPDELKGELHGDVVQVELPVGTDASLVRRVLAGLPAVRDVVIAGRDVSARSDDGAAAVPVVLAELQRAGINAASVAVARPSLDDVYLRHTGRRYSESETPDRNGHANELETVEASK